MAHEEGSGLRRWIDKALLASLVLVGSLVTFVFISLSERVSRLEASDDDKTKRIVILEERLKYCADGIDRIEKKIDKLGEKK